MRASSEVRFVFGGYKESERWMISMQTILASFNTRHQADKAIEELRDRGGVPQTCVTINDEHVVQVDVSTGILDQQMVEAILHHNGASKVCGATEHVPSPEEL